MNRETVLRETLKATNTCLDSVKALQSVNKDEQFSVVLLEQEKTYRDLQIKVKSIGVNENVCMEDEGFFPKVMLWSMTMMKTLTDKSPSKLAEMMITGITMGIISLTKIVNALDPDVDSSQIDEIMSAYNATIDAMKPFLI